MRLLPVTLGAAALSALLLSLSGCNVQDPGRGPIIVRLTLHDSLKRYDSVQVAVADAARPEADLEMMRSGKGPLADPQVPAYTLTKAKDPFVVKVRGYRGNHQLALETHIYYEAGKKRVVHRDVPPQVPNNWLTQLSPSAGVLTPGFSLDHLDYTLDLPLNTSVLHFDLKTVYVRAVTTVAGDTLRVGAPPKVFPIGRDTFVVPISVTDLGTTRTYRVTVKPVFPKARLDSISFSAGTLERPFHPDSADIALVVPMEVNTVEVKLWTTDAATRLTWNDERLFEGEVRTVTLSSRPTHFESIRVLVTGTTDSLAYNLTVKR